MKKDISSIVIVLCIVGILVIVGFITVVKLIDMVTEPSPQTTEELATVTTKTTVEMTSAAPTKETSASPSPTPERKKLKIDSYTSWWSTHVEYFEGDFNFSITGNSRGTMYLMNHTILEMQKKDFNYNYVGNILTFNFDDGTKSEYRVSKNEIGNMVLTVRKHRSLFHNLYSYSTYMIRSFSANEFTAFGCWYRFSAKEGYLETISLWHNNEGIYYNSEENEPKPFSYDYSNYVLTLRFKDYIKKYTINHLGNVLELKDGDTGLESFMFRAHETILCGKYQLKSSTNDNMKKLNITLGEYGDLKIEYDDGTISVSGTEHSWYVDRGDGYIGMYDDARNGEYSFLFNYYLTKEGLYLSRTNFSDTYYLEKIE